MQGITDPAEEYFKDGSWAWDPVGKVWLKLIIDPLTNRLIVNIPGETEVVQTVPADLVVGAHGWDGTVWRKLPLVWGYSGQYIEAAHASNVAAGDAYWYFSQVPEGEIWVVTRVVITPAQANATLLSCGVYDGATWFDLNSQTTMVVNTPLIATGPITMVKDDRLFGYYADAHLNDDFYGRAFGYKMKIAE